MEMFQYWLVGLQAAAVNKDLFLDDLLGLSEGFKKKARLSSVRCGAGLMLTRQDAHCARSVAEGKKKNPQRCYWPVSDWQSDAAEHVIGNIPQLTRFLNVVFFLKSLCASSCTVSVMKYRLSYWLIHP